MEVSFQHRAAGRRGFTLIELLVVIAIIGILAGMLLPCLAKAKQRGKMINEIHAAKQMMLSYQMYTDDNGDKVMPGYNDAMEAFDDEGTPLTNPRNARYPWRLAPYLSKNFRAIYVNENAVQLREFEAKSHENYVYFTSLFPSLGVNGTFVGGDVTSLLKPTETTFAKVGNFCVLRGSDARRPSDLIVFASAQGSEDPTGTGNRYNGYFKVTPPYLNAKQWETDFSPDSLPAKYGNVHPRFSGKTVVAILDGHAEAFNKEKIEDMRHWANQADRADWTVQKVTPP